MPLSDSFFQPENPQIQYVFLDFNGEPDIAPVYFENAGQDVYGGICLGGDPTGLGLFAPWSYYLHATSVVYWYTTW